MTKMVSNLSNPPLYLVLLAVVLELFFAISDVQVEFAEMWIVALAVPLALLLAKPSEEGTKQKLIAEARPTKGQGQRRPPVVRPGEVKASPSTEKSVQKAKIDTCVKEGNV